MQSEQSGHCLNYQTFQKSALFVYSNFLAIQTYDDPDFRCLCCHNLKINDLQPIYSAAKLTNEETKAVYYNLVEKNGTLRSWENLKHEPRLFASCY